MGQMYAKFMTGVSAEFVLNVRRTPYSLSRMRAEQPGLWAQLQERVAALAATPPLPPPVVEALRLYYDFEPSQVRVGKPAASQGR